MHLMEPFIWHPDIFYNLDFSKQNHILFVWREMCWRARSFNKALELCTPNLGIPSFSSFIWIYSSVIRAAGHLELDSMCCSEGVCRNLGSINFSFLYLLASEKHSIILAWSICIIWSMNQPIGWGENPNTWCEAKFHYYLVVKRGTSHVWWTSLEKYSFVWPLINARRTEHKLSM